MSAVRRWAEAGPTTREQSGFTLLELVIVIILVVLLFLTATWRLLPLRGEAEAAHVATTVGTLRSALGLHVAERIVKDSPDAVVQLDGSNPIQLLEQAPGSYIGEIESATAETPRGTWYFETATNRLGYRLRYPQYLAGSPEGPIDLYWRIRARFSDSNEAGVPDAGKGSLRAIGLEALHDDPWRELDTAENLTDPQK